METLRPAHEVYHRLRWGGGVPLDQVEVVVLDRVRGERTMAFGSFHPKGPIPFSRVLAFVIAGERVWDREARIDRVLGSGVTPGQRWVGGTATAVDRIRVLTYNVLFDRFDRAIVRTAERIDRLLSLMEDSDADLIALQEVERPLLTRILAEPWVAGHYAASDGPEGATVDPYGQLLLSRLPLIDVGIARLGGNKRHLLATVDLGDRHLSVAVVHLSSDVRGPAQAARDAQIEALRDRLAGSGPVLVLGDFNQTTPVDLPLVDVWPEVHPDDPGFTFDPDRNALARALSVSGRRQRIDRILVAGLQAQRASLVGVDPGALPPSDHHGVLADLVVEGASVGQTWSALVLPVPPEVAARLEPIRRRFDANRWRWPPHATLFHAEVDRGALASWLPGAVDAAARLPPLDVTFDRIEVFRQSSRRLLVAVADAASTGALRTLRRPFEAGPFAVGRPLVPHLTLARLSASDRQLPQVRAAIAAQLPIRWRARRLALWGRDDAGPMVPVADLPFAGEGLAPVPTLDQALQIDGSAACPGAESDVKRIVADVRRAAGAPAVLVGSAALGASLPEADLDLSVRAIDPLAARRRLAATVAGRPIDGEVPTWLFQAQVGGLPRWIDVAFLPPDDPGPEEEAAAIRAAVADRPHFSTVLRLVKAFAAARQVSDPAWGFPGGLAYAVAVASCPRPTPEAWVAATFEALLSDDPIALGDAPVAAPEGPRPWIWTSTPPRRTVIRQLLPCTARVLADELERALILAWDGDWSTLLRAAMPTDEPVVAITIRGPDRDAALGWLRGRARTLVAALAQGGGAVRPWPRPVPRNRAIRLCVSVPGVDPEVRAAAMAELAARFEQGTDRPAEAELSVTFRPAG